jgi:hypothetical protein
MAASEHEIAYSMKRLWGRQAKALAGKYALEYEDLENAAEAARWSVLQHIVSEWHQCHERLRAKFPPL